MKTDFLKKAQVTPFVIIAIVIVALAVLFVVFRSSIFSAEIPANLEPVYKTFLQCLEDKTKIGINVLESQAGYIELPKFESGSLYMPFSSQLNFLGNDIPYWYYVSGNNIQKQQVPTIQEMQDQLSIFIDDKIRNCVYDIYYSQGFEIDQGSPKTKVKIKSEEVQVELEMEMQISKANDLAVVNSHKISVKSKFGELYESAKKIYDYEQDSLFLEKYGIDVLRLYAPVDGVELTCSPKIWNAEDVFDELENAIESNVLALKIKGGDFSLTKEENKYFVVDAGVSNKVNVMFLNSKQWPHGFEVNPSDGPVLISNPVGNQAGLGALGFCYVPYHFVYNVNYPVLVQIYSGEEIFQFPVAVVISGNNPREPVEGAIAIAGEVDELCENKNVFTTIKTYDNYFNSIDANISFECSGTRCEIGESSGGILSAELPQCVNGLIRAKTNGFDDGKTIYSSIETGEAEINLKKLYEKEIKLKISGQNYSGQAIISFSSESGISKTIIYPEQKSVELTEGQYEVQVSVYKNSSINLEATTHRECIEIPQSGLGSIFGLTKEKCFEVEIPAQVISNVLAGGGTENYYIVESELINSEIVEINAESLPTPKSLEELQVNYLAFEERGLDIYFK